MILPVYDSRKQCHQATGISVAIQSAAAERGCDAFHHGRVGLEKLLRFLYGAHGKDLVNWQDHFTEAKAKREWVKLQKDEANVIDRGHVRDGIARLAGIVDRVTEKKFVSELPPAAVGLDAMAISALCKRAKAEMWEEFRAAIETVGQSNE